MEWDKDFDVKEYIPRRKREKSYGVPLPGARDRGGPADGVDSRDGGVMMTTSEMLDFAEGSDSYV